MKSGKTILASLPREATYVLMVSPSRLNATVSIVRKHCLKTPSTGEDQIERILLNYDKL